MQLNFSSKAIQAPKARPVTSATLADLEWKVIADHRANSALDTASLAPEAPWEWTEYLDQKANPEMTDQWVLSALEDLVIDFFAITVVFKSAKFGDFSQMSKFAVFSRTFDG